MLHPKHKAIHERMVTKKGLNDPRRFSDDTFIEGDGETLRLLPLIMQCSTARVPLGVAPLINRPQSPAKHAENPASDATASLTRPFSDKLLQRVRNKFISPAPPPAPFPQHHAVVRTGYDGGWQRPSTS